MRTPLRADDLSSAWDRNQWKPVYLFAGPEEFLIREALTRLSSAKAPAEGEGLNRDRLDGETHRADEIINTCRTVPFFASTRVVEVAHASDLSAEDQRMLAEFLPQLPANTFLVLLWSKPWRKDDLKKPLLEAALQTGELVIFWPLYPEQAQRWLLQRARLSKRALSSEAAGWLVEQAGESLSALDQELTKAMIFAGERTEIGLDDVQASFGYQKACSPYEWMASLRKRKSAEAVRILGRLLEEGEEPLRLMAILSGSLRDWLSAKGTQESLPALAARFRLRRGEETSFLRDLEAFSSEDLMEGLAACVESEDHIKTGREAPEMALTLLTLRLCRLQPSYASR